MTSAAFAMLWESWMMTRWSYLSRLLVVCTMMLLFVALHESRATHNEDDVDALRTILWLFAALGAFSGLTVGRSPDGASGFPFSLGFWRPVPTWLQVIVPMGYRTAWCTALYLLPMLAAHLAYEMPALLMSASVLIVPTTLMTIANSWWTDRKGVGQLLGLAVVSLCTFALFYYTLHFDQDYPDDPELDWWWAFSFSLVDYLIVVVVSVSAMLLVFAGVEGQRHGDESLRIRRSGGNGDDPYADDWLAETYQTECPTTSARRAELWAEINGHGLPVVVWCLAGALTLPTLWLVTDLMDSPFFFGCVTSIVCLLPLITGTPSFGIRIKQGSAAMSTFDATRPMTTAWLAGVKLGVAFVSMTLGAAFIAVSFWLSAPLVEDFVFFVATTKVFFLDAAASMSATHLTCQVYVALVQLATLVAFLASVQATYVRYADRVTITILCLLLYSGVPVVLVAAEVIPLWVGIAHVWALTGVIVLGAVYFTLSLAREHIMTVTQLAVLITAWLLYAAAYFELAREDGLFDPETPLAFIVFQVGVCVLSLTVFVLAPWALARARNG